MRKLKNPLEQKRSRLYHGTSRKQIRIFQDNNWQAEELHLCDVAQNCDHYAEVRADEDDSTSAYLVLNARKLERSMIARLHSLKGRVRYSGLRDNDSYGEDSDQGQGEYIYNGPIREALMAVVIINDDGEEEQIDPDYRTCTVELYACYDDKTWGDSIFVDIPEELFGNESETIDWVRKNTKALSHGSIVQGGIYCWGSGNE